MLTKQELHEIHNYIDKAANRIANPLQLHSIFDEALRRVSNPLLDALEFARGAIVDAICLEDGLDGADGEAVLGVVDDQLKAHGRAVPVITEETHPSH